MGDESEVPIWPERKQTMGRLESKVAFLAGSGAGIGRSAAVLFAKEGAKVAVADLDTSRGKETVHMVDEAGGRAIYIRMDATNPNSVEEAIRKTVQEFGKLDIIDCNVGGSAPDDVQVDESTIEIWERTLRFNLLSAFLCCKYGIPELKKNRGGAIILMGSQAGLLGWKRPAYSAAKGGIIALTRVLAIDYARYNIRANCICPALVLTERTIKERDRNPMVFEDMRPQHLLGFGDPLDIAYAKLYLASDESKSVTGAIFSIDSGYTAVGRIDPKDLFLGG
jgi:NAD(P)-dependent dehydrogenase (short-subunit alcohol dehydrogenase family)